MTSSLLCSLIKSTVIEDSLSSTVVMKSQVSNANASSSGTHDSSTEKIGETHRFDYADWTAHHMSMDERTNFTPADLVASVDRYLRQSIDPTAPKIVL
jgi:hypothetical protein